MTGTVLITGAAQRNGRQMALDLAGNGWAVAVHYNTSQDEANKLVADIVAAGGRAVAVQGDLSASDAPARIVSGAVAALGPLTCLINNASRFEPDEAGTCTWIPICVRRCCWHRPLQHNCRRPDRAISSTLSTSVF